MKSIWHTGLKAAWLAGFPLAAAAQVQELYFNQQGQVTANMSAVAYVRQYEVKDGIAQAQDFYYPSMKKYSDPYQVAAGQIRSFVPVPNNGELTLWHFNGQKKMSGRYKNGKPDGV